MSEQLNQLFLEIQKTSYLEWIAFIFSLIYLILATLKNNWCWIFAILSSAIYVYIFYSVNFYFDSILQLFYIAMAMLGWLNWNKTGEKKLIITKKTNYHIISISITLLTSVIFGFIFDTYTKQVFPYIDSAIFFFSIFATYLITKKILENWIYFVIIDFIAIYIYWQRDLLLTSVLFFIYTILAFYAFILWKKDYKKSKLNT
jgi:nicotinamide mononucleotide transporter